MQDVGPVSAPEDQAVCWALLPGMQCLQSEPYILRRASGDGGKETSGGKGTSGRPPISRELHVLSFRGPRCWVGQD